MVSFCLPKQQQDVRKGGGPDRQHYHHYCDCSCASVPHQAVPALSLCCLWQSLFDSCCWQVVKRAVASQPESMDAVERAEKFRQKYWGKLQTLRHQPL